MRRFNIIDGAIVTALVAAAGFGVVAYERAQVPGPQIAAVSPAQIVVGKGRKLRIEGRNLHPYLRAMVNPMGQPFAIHPLNPLVQEAAIEISTGTTLDVVLPELVPGPYDVYLFDAFQQLAVAPRAFTVVEPTFPRATITAILRVFTPSATAKLLTIGDTDHFKPLETDVSAREEAVITALHVGADDRDEREMRIATYVPNDGVAWMGVQQRIAQVDVTLRVPLVMDVPDVFRYKGAPVRAGDLLTLETARFKQQGAIVWVDEPVRTAAPATGAR